MTGRHPALRTVVLAITIGSFALAALLGVIALLGGGAFGRTEVNVLLTTLLVGAASVLVLCYVSTAGSWYQWLGVVGGFAVAASVVAALVMIWGDFPADPPELVAKGFGVGSTVAVTLAQASLLLVLADQARPVVRRLMGGTLVAAGLLAGLVSSLVLGVDNGWAYARFIGIVAILDVLGTVVVAALSRLGVHGEAHVGDRTELLVVPEELAGLVRAEARRSGRDPQQVVRDAIEEHVGVGADAERR